LVDALPWGGSAARREGSSPFDRTMSQLYQSLASSSAACICGLPKRLL